MRAGHSIGSISSNNFQAAVFSEIHAETCAYKINRSSLVKAKIFDISVTET